MSPEIDRHPSLEDLAAFLDGRLRGEPREAMMAHLNTCEACYEVFAESVRFQAERLRSESGGGEAEVVAFPEAERVGPGWRRLAAAAALVLMVGGLAYWRTGRPPAEGSILTASAAELVAPLARSGDLPEVTGDLWRSGPLPSFAPTRSEDRWAFLFGVHLVDAVAAAQAEEPSAAAAALDQILTLGAPPAGAAGLDGAVRRARQALEATGATGAGLSAFAELEEQALGGLERLPLAFGKWAEAARLSAVAEHGPSFTAADFPMAATWFEAGQPEPVRRNLAELRRLAAEPTLDFDEVERTLANLIRLQES